jgi:hypothetical protein
VRRIVIAERERKRRNADELDQLLADLLAGRFPYVLVEHKLVGLAPRSGAELPGGDQLPTARPGRTRRGGRVSPASFTLGFTGSASGGAPKERRVRSRSGFP